jgi:hypothetical protein
LKSTVYEIIQAGRGIFVVVSWIEENGRETIKGSAPRVLNQLLEG